jgi:hypothetical protein
MDERLWFVARLLEGEKMAPLCAEFMRLLTEVRMGHMGGIEYNDTISCYSARVRPLTLPERDRLRSLGETASRPSGHRRSNRPRMRQAAVLTTPPCLREGWWSFIVSPTRRSRHASALNRPRCEPMSARAQNSCRVCSKRPNNGNARGWHHLCVRPTHGRARRACLSSGRGGAPSLIIPTPSFEPQHVQH